MRARTAQLYPGRDTFEFDQGHVTKNQPITVLILLSESLASNKNFWLTCDQVVLLETTANVCESAGVKQTIYSVFF